MVTFSLHQIHEREDQDPDEIDEMPVQRGDLDRVVLGGRVTTAERLDEDAAQIDDASEDVAAVEAREAEEGRREQRRAEGVSREAHPVLDEVRPLERLHAEERDSAEDRQSEEAAQTGLVAMLDRRQALHHRDAAAN